MTLDGAAREYTMKEINVMLQTHNDLRAQEGAAGMMKMVSKPFQVFGPMVFLSPPHCHCSYCADAQWCVGTPSKTVGWTVHLGSWMACGGWIAIWWKRWWVVYESSGKHCALHAVYGVSLDCWLGNIDKAFLVISAAESSCQNVHLKSFGAWFELATWEQINFIWKLLWSGKLASLTADGISTVLCPQSRVLLHRLSAE